MSNLPSVILCGYGQFGCAALHALQQAGLTVLLVLTHSDNQQENCWWQSLATMASDAGIPVLRDADLSVGSHITQLIKEYAPSFIFSAFYRDLLGQHLLDIPRLGAWNLHPSLLPAYRGRAPINWQLVHGEKQTGLTVHRMLTRADAGGIIAQQAVAIDPDQDAYGLTRQLLTLAPCVLSLAIREILSGTPCERIQHLAAGSVFGRRRPADGQINWQLPARTIHNLVRAVAPPWPGAHALLNGQSLLITKTYVVDELSIAGVPGTVLPGNRVMCGTGVISLIGAFYAAQQIGLLTPGLQFTHVSKDTP